MTRAIDATIRPATPADCDAILTVHTSALRELCKGEYSQTQLAAWVERLTPEGYLPAIARNVFLVAEFGGRVVGFAEFALPRGEVVAIYVAPDCARSGLGTRLFGAMEQLANAHGVRSMNLSSSVSAVAFYEKLGFVAGERGVHRLGNGTEIPCVPMKRLST